MPRKHKPADTCNLIVRIRGVDYTARPVRPETSDCIRAWRLRRPNGEAYLVGETIDGATCECGDFVFRHEGNDQVGCKHVRALRALGLLDPDGEDPADWPSWTDTHAYTTAGPAPRLVVGVDRVRDEFDD
jgi:hypothetical protein